MENILNSTITTNIFSFFRPWSSLRKILLWSGKAYKGNKACLLWRDNVMPEWIIFTVGKCSQQLLFHPNKTILELHFFPYLCLLKTSNMQKQYSPWQGVWCPRRVQLGTVAYFGLYIFIVKHNFVTGSETLHETRVESKHPNQILPAQRESVSNAKLWAMWCCEFSSLRFVICVNMMETLPRCRCETMGLNVTKNQPRLVYQRRNQSLLIERLLK